MHPTLLRPVRSSILDARRSKPQRPKAGIVKVTFVYPDFLSVIPGWKGHFYVGLASLSAVLKRAGHETSLIHIANSDYSKEAFLHHIGRSKPDLIGFSSTTVVHPFVERILGWMEEEGIDTPTVSGGVHPTVVPEQVIRSPRMDMVCIGEGEETLLELVTRMENGDPIRDIPGLWTKEEDGTVVRGPRRPIVQDLDTLPPPDRELFDLESCFMESQGIASFMVSRGCPFSCTYCANHTLRKLYGAKGYVRFRSVDSVLHEIRTTLQRYPSIRRCFFDDDILFLNLQWGEEFAERYAREVNLPYCCNVRPKLFDERRALLQKRSNCDSVKIGIESGNDFIRNQVLKRRLTEADMMKSLALCQQYGFEVTGYNMVGLPYETPQTVLETVKMNARGGVQNVQVAIFYPFPGTECYDLCRKNGWLAEEERPVEDCFTDSLLSMPTIGREQIIFFRQNFERLMHAYRMLDGLPPPARRAAESFLEAVVTHSGTPVAFQATRSVYRGMRNALGRLLPGVTDRALKARRSSSPVQ